MPKTLEPQITPQKPGMDREKFELIAGGHAAFQLFWAGIDLGLYNLLSRCPGITEPEIQEALKLEKKPTRILLVGLLALGLIERDGEAYRNCRIVEEQMVDGKPECLSPIFGWQALIMYPGLADFVASLKENRHVGLRHFPGSGNNLYERLVSNPDLEKVFQRSMSFLTQKTNPGLFKAYDFGRFKRVLDVGGGDGTNATSLVKAFPNVRATIFDTPSISKLAKRNIHEQGLDGKVDVHTGDFLKDPFPKGIDAVIFNHIFTIWSEKRNQMLLKKSYDALPKGGAVFIYGMVMSDDDLKPLTAAFGSLYFLTIATGEGMLYRWKDYTSWVRGAGFSKVERIEGLPLHHGLVVGIK